MGAAGEGVRGVDGGDAAGAGPRAVGRRPQSLAGAEDSELARRLRKRAAATGKRLSFMNEYLPEERDPVRCWLIVAAVAFVTLLGNR